MTLPPTPAPHRRGIFVTGTDTGVGKTVVACGLARLAADRGHRMIPFKPVETGCAPDPGDARALWEAARRPVPRDAVCLYPLALPAAPAVAAAFAKQVIDLDAIERHADQLQSAGDALIIEGAGGLLVPYRDAATTADLARQLGLPLLVVARSALGTINHTALTLLEIRRRQLPLAGLILVETTADGNDPAENSNQINILTGFESLGTVPHLPPDADADRKAAALAAAIGEIGISHLFRQARLIA